jgi:hypothetical protein
MDLDAPVIGVAFSPDGSWALAATNDALTVRDLESGKQLRRFGPDKNITCIALSPDGRFVLVGCGLALERIEQPLTLWDVQTGKELGSFEGHQQGGTSSVAFSRDGRFVLSGGYDRDIILWNVQTRQPVWGLLGNADLVGGVGFSPDGLWAISGGVDGTVRLWNLSTGKELRMLGGHATAAGSVAFTPDGQRALSGHSDETVRVWDFSRIPAYADIQNRAAVARAYLELHPDYPPALRALAEWYWFRGVYDWAVELAEKSRAGGEVVSPLMLARCYWQLSDELPKSSAMTRQDCLAAARREFAAALDQCSDPGERAYLKLLLDSPALGPGGTSNPVTKPER